MSVYITGDFGSCHLGRLNIAKELIRVAKECGLDAVKGQLWEKEKPPNIKLPFEWIGELKRYADEIGIDIYFSVWGLKAIIEMRKVDIRSIKFAYSNQKELWWLCEKSRNHEYFNKIYCSLDFLDDWPKNIEKGKIIKYWCIPQYPVPFEPDFYGKFERMDGFSDHTMGYHHAVQATRAGAKYIEKHFRLEDKMQETVPDGRFAIKPYELKDMVLAIRQEGNFR